MTSNRLHNNVKSKLASFVVTRWTVLLDGFPFFVLLIRVQKALYCKVKGAFPSKGLPQMQVCEPLHLLHLEEARVAFGDDVFKSAIKRGEHGT